MARTPSVMIDLGTKAPEFSLLEPATAKHIDLQNYASQAVLIAFICNHCPFVIHIMEKFTELAAKYQNEGVAVIAINANDVVNYPDDSPEKMVEFVNQYGLSFPYLFDEKQQVAKAYQAACTPDLYLFDSNHALFYRGQFDSARPGNDIGVTGDDLDNAVNALLKGETAPVNQKASLGCNIKWKAGNEPDYF